MCYTMQDEVFMEKAIELSKLAVEHGNEPFGAVLVKDGKAVFCSQNTTHPRVCGLQYPPKVDISNQHNPQGWAYRWHCGSSAFRPDAISAPTTVPGNSSGSPRLRDT